MSSADAAALASRTLGRAVPARPVGSGGNHHSWWIGGRHVLRWAPDFATSRRLEREVVLRRWLREHLRSPVPEAVADGTWQSCGWVLDERLIGRGLEEGLLTARTHSDLVELLVDLGRCPVGDAAAAMEFPTKALPDLPELAEEGLAAHRALGISRPLTPPVDTGLDERGWAARPVLVHADLKGEHLLIGDAGQLTGVLDWSDAGIGDVSLDIEGLVVAVGADKAAQVASLAAVPEAAVARGVFLARCHTAMRLDALLNRGEPSGPEPLLRHQQDLAWN